MTENAHIGAHLKAWRRSCGLRQVVVAERVGVSQRSVSAWETGRRTISSADLARLVVLYGVDAATAGGALCRPAPQE